MNKYLSPLLLGTLSEFKEHAETMRSTLAMKHAAPNMIALAPGHMEAGMVGTIKVE